MLLLFLLLMLDVKLAVKLTVLVITLLQYKKMSFKEQSVRNNFIFIYH